jgi:hypothetical protein
MSDAQAAQGTIAPATTAPATAQAQPAQVDPDTEPKDFPKWFGPRVEQAKRSATNEILKTLGVESVDAAKAAVEAAKKLEEQRKSDVEKLTERLSSLEPKATRASALEERLGRMADSALAGLTEAQRSAVLAIAKDDKTAVLDTIEALRPTWAALAAPAVAAPLPAPAKTTAATAAPATASPSASTDYRATYEALKAENPLAAAQFLNLHSRQIFPGQ